MSSRCSPSTVVFPLFSWFALNPVRGSQLSGGDCQGRRILNAWILGNANGGLLCSEHPYRLIGLDSRFLGLRSQLQMGYSWNLSGSL